MEPNAPGYALDDPRPIAAEAPYTFFLPSTAEIAAVGKGDIVKLIFRYSHDAEKWQVERMWVIVEEVKENGLRGRLDNHPDEPTSPLKADDSIEFQRHHIISIDWANPQAAPPRPMDRSYWERCLVDQCVLDGKEPVEYLYREEPEPLDEGDTYPDSGWSIRGRRGEASDEEMDAREVVYVALGAVLNCDDSWIGWIDAPAGTQLMRDFETNTYFEQS
jgi:hypothetical protein